MEEKTIGNSVLIQNDEDRIAAYLKERNLSKTNSMSAKVQPRCGIYSEYIKRILDLCIAIPAFIVTLPFNVFFGICTFFDVGRPIFFRQTRIGKDQVPFVLVKFRNMNNNTDDYGKLLPARERVTKFGYFMRSHSFDELLNFWNVIKGDMSIIGPRPLPSFFYDRMSDRHKMRSIVRPGLECPRVISVEGEKYQKQFENDIWYVENISIKTDIKMMLLLFKMTFAKDIRKSAEGGKYFVGYDDNGRAIYKDLAIELYESDMKEENK